MFCSKFDVSFEFRIGLFIYYKFRKDNGFRTGKPSGAYVTSNGMLNRDKVANANYKILNIWKKKNFNYL